MKTNTFFAVFLIALFGLCLTGCQQDDDIIDPIPAIADFKISDPQIRKEIEFLQTEGIIGSNTYTKWSTMREEEIIFTGGLSKQVSETEIWNPEYYIISPLGASDGTMIHRKEVQQMMKEKEKNQPSETSARMKRQANMYSSNGGTITIRVIESGPSTVPIAWRTAISQAISTWNNRGLKVKFKRVTASNDLIIGGYVTIGAGPVSDSNVFAHAGPVNSPGYHGEYIVINTTPGTTPNVNGKKYTMIHELGHILGFKHTEDIANGSTIFNTAVLCDEAVIMNSFMYGYIAYNQTFTDFSLCDKTNLSYYWGYGLLA